MVPHDPFWQKTKLPIIGGRSWKEGNPIPIRVNYYYGCQ